MSYVIRASSMISNCLYFRVYSGAQDTERRAPKADETDVDGAELTPQLNAVLSLSVPFHVFIFIKRNLIFNKNN